MPNFEVLDAKIASALNRIIRGTQFTRKVSLEEQKAPKEDRFLRGRQIAHADLFAIALRNDDIQEFNSKWGRNSMINDKNPI